MEYNFFELIVAGDAPQEQMKKYDSKIRVQPYVVYRKSDAENIKAKYIHEYSLALNSEGLSDVEQNRIMELISTTATIPASSFFDDFTEDYDHDSEGNAISTTNPDARWSFYQIGKLFSVPFITLDGREVFQARKCDIDWKKMHLSGQEIYKRAWEMVVEGSKPKDEYEQKIYENMKNRTAYFSNFENKKAYVVYSTAFWGYAFLSEDTGWVELDEGTNQFDWVSNYHEKFIKPLPDDTLLTIYECKK